MKPTEKSLIQKIEPADNEPHDSSEGNRRQSRARKSVNYALPSLRAKMRRQTDQLVNAVIILPDMTEKDSSDIEQKYLAEVKIKQEDSEAAVNFDTVGESPKMTKAGNAINRTLTASSNEIHESGSNNLSEKPSRRKSEINNKKTGGRIELVSASSSTAIKRRRSMIS
ncbi:hypothetical protein V1514DRAFT_325088 [Lipomyces japonicus]|uniref:uncharacterized protein n=1 Tax=Lipomyces japonicus TaxID=56871 RepID=UPI0034CF513C